LQVIYGDPAKAKAALGWRYDLSFEDLIARLVEDELSLPARAE
jgi:GDP-D-mannose dehydratase